MAPTNPIRIRLRYADLDTFVEKFAPNVTRGGVFLASRHVQPVGAVVSFEIQLLDGDVALAGQGRVSWVKEFNAGEPHRPYGMGVQFVAIDPGSRPILARVLRFKEANGSARRPTTGPLAPLDVRGADAPAGGGLNGRAAAAPPVLDTSVDLAAEYGLDDQTVRRLIERTWMTGARSSDDLADLLRPEPTGEPVTLAQALAELPRLIDPQYSRRRASSGFRTLDGRGGPISGAATGGGGPTSGAGEGLVEGAPQALGAETNEATEDGDTRPGSGDASDTTDMTGTRDTVESMPAVFSAPEAEAEAGSEIGAVPAQAGQTGRRRRRR